MAHLLLGVCPITGTSYPDPRPIRRVPTNKNTPGRIRDFHYAGPLTAITSTNLLPNSGQPVTSYQGWPTMKILSIPGCSTMIRRMMSAEIYTAMMG